MSNKVIERNTSQYAIIVLAMLTLEQSSAHYYDDNGIRTSKTAGNTVTTYATIDGRITSQKTGDALTYFYYDSDNALLGMNYGGNDYVYLKNLQGDVVGLVDTTGQLVVEYGYDAWGNLTSTTGNNAIADANPFRYRGYYFDSETGLYYLQSRYYDAEVGRFINADAVEMLELGGDDGLGSNAFAYCRNNPLVYQDQNGKFISPIQYVFMCIGFMAGWFLGDYVAQRLGYSATSKNFWNRATYWTIRTAVVFGGAALGYFSATVLVAILKGFLFASPALIAATPVWVYNFLGIGTGAGTYVLGKYPLYLQLAEKLGSGVFSIALDAWNRMSSSQQWNANVGFLNKIMLRAQKITLQTNAYRATGIYLKEINYLLEHGYKIVENGWALVKK